MNLKKISFALLALIATSTARASVTLPIDAGVLANSSGVAIPVGSLVLLLASQGDNLFQASTVGSYVTGDDIVVASFAMDYDGGFGEMMNVANFSYTTSGSASATTFDVGDLLALRWFPNITFSQFQGGTKPAADDFYGTYSAIGTPDGGISWVAPTDGWALPLGEGLNMFTSNTEAGGSLAPSAGYASSQVVPEPSTFALLGLGVAGWIARRRKA